MATLIQIGNSQGVRIPKLLIEQAQLEDKDIEFEVVPEGLLIKPISSNPRAGWGEQIVKIQEQHLNQPDEGLIESALNHETDLEDWEW